MEDTTAQGPPSTTRPPRSGPKWESDTRDRLKTQIRRFSKPLAELSDRDANEGDTRLLVTDFLTEALGFDKYAELTTEYQVKGEFADYGIRLDRELVAFLETKRIRTKLAPKHLRQVEMYAVNEGVEWVILTNGALWQAYHLDVSSGLPVVMDRVLDVDLLSDDSIGRKAGALFYLTKESLKRRQINDLWERTRATSPKALANALLSPAVVEAIRKQVRKRSGHKIEPAEVGQLLRETVIREECLKP